MTATDLCRALGKDPKQGLHSIRQSLSGLEKSKGFVKKAGSVKADRYKAKNLWLPTEEGRTWFDQQRAAYPDP